MASGGGGGSGGSAPQPGGAAAWYPAPARECESCRSAPGIPFCRVEWSFLCAGCAAVIHCHDWVVAVTPSPNTNANPNTGSSSNPDPSFVVPLSSAEEEPLTGSGRRGGRRRRGAVEGRALHRAESVMRYREKRKSRTFEKTVRYETRRAYADLRPRVDGKFARREGAELPEETGEPTPVVAAGEVTTGGDCIRAKPNVHGQVQPVEEGEHGGGGGGPVI